MRQRARVDKNHQEIVRCLKTLGCTVLSLHAMGKGVPDLLIGYQGHCYLVEVKDKTGRVNAVQKEWHQAWNTPVYVVKTTIECVNLLNSLRSNNG